MEGSQIGYVVRRPDGVKLIVGMCMLCLSLYFSWRSLDQDDVGQRFILIVLSLYSLAVLLWVVYLTLKKPTELTLRDETLEVNGKRLEAGEIKTILFKQEWGHTVIGIKPIGKRMVPISLCFRFAGDEEDGEAALTSWAERNGVKMAHTFFFRWL